MAKCGACHQRTSMRFATFLAIAALCLFAEPASADTLEGSKLSLLWALPFVGILLSIATGPLLYAHLWEHHYGKFATLWGVLVVLPMFLTFSTDAVTSVLAHTALLEYFPFILLLVALYTT